MLYITMSSWLYIGPQFITIRRIFESGSREDVSVGKDKCQFDIEALNPSF